MTTYSRLDEHTGRVVGFEVENVYISPSSVASLLRSVAGVSDVRKRRLFDAWEDVHVWFRFLGAEGKVWEPYGDSSRYWIGQEESESVVDISAIEAVFKAYKPPIWRRVIGDIFTLRFLGRSSA